MYRLYYCTQLNCEFFQTNVKKINEWMNKTLKIPAKN